ncbi:MAG: cation transporter [Candidatus Competibacteraceae bacterium]|jgi:Co/Zn/Cd efflux system component|nr:cation transporter [Candidatus Competibacteraceae bacterium]
MGFWVLGWALYQVLILDTPVAPIMGGIGLLALLANTASVIILFLFRDGDAKVRSVWLCSRNDAIGNLAVIVAAGGVWLTASAWPDLLVALVMAGLFLYSSGLITPQATLELRSEQQLGCAEST